MMFTHEGLVRYTSDLGVQPGLAESWDTKDLKKWTFHMVDNATWDDGVPVTANDAKFTIDYTKEKKIAWGPEVYVNVVSVEAPDEDTLIINLKQPDYNFLTQLCNMPYVIPEHIFKDVSDPEKFDDEKAVVIGCGPYKFAGFDRSAGILEFKAKDDYRNGKPAVDTIVLKLFKDSATLLLAFRNGEVDAPYIYNKGVDYYDVPKLLQNDNIKLMMINSFGIRNVLYFNNGKVPFNNKGLRVALSYAIDYEELKSLFTGEYGTIPDAGFVPKGVLDYVSTRTMTYDADKSKQMLESLGYVDTDGDGFREAPDGSKFLPELVSRNDDESQRLAETIQKYFKAVGLDLQLRIVDSSTFGDTKSERQMCIYPAPLWALTDFENYYTGPVDARYYATANVTDPKFVSLADEIGTTMDQDKRKEIISDLQYYYADEMPQIPLYAMDYIQPYDKKYEGWVTDPLWGILSHRTFFDLHEV